MRGFLLFKAPKRKRAAGAAPFMPSGNRYSPIAGAAISGRLAAAG